MTVCEQCHESLTAEEQALGWPVGMPAEADGTDVEYVCPACYGDEAYCRECGAVLPAEEEGSLCERCAQAEEEV